MCRFTEPIGSYFVTICNLYILGCWAKQELSSVLFLVWTHYINIICFPICSCLLSLIYIYVLVCIIGNLMWSVRLQHMQQSLLWKKIVEKLSMDFEIIYAFRATCAQFSTISYVDHVELRVLAKEMDTLELPTVDL